MLKKGVNGALKRAYDYFDSTEDKESVKQEEDEDGEASSYGMIKKVCSADSGNMRIMRKAMDFFFALLREQNISSFLDRDSCCLISDKVRVYPIFPTLNSFSFTRNICSSTHWRWCSHISSEQVITRQRTLHK